MMNSPFGMRFKINARSIAILIYYLLIAISASFPFGRMFTSPLLIALFTTFFIYVFLMRKTVFKTLPDKKTSVQFLLPATYYGLCIVGLIHTSNMKEGIFELDKKITMLALPIVLLTMHSQLSSTQVRNLLKSFLSAITACGVISIGIGFYHSIKIVNGELVFRTAVNDIAYERGYHFFQQVTQGGNYFFGNYISPFIHTNYYGLYLSVGCVLAFYLFAKNKTKYQYLVIGVFLLCVLILCDSRGPLLSFVVSILIVLGIGIKSKLAKRVLPLILIGSIIILSISPRTSLLFADLKQSVTSLNYNSNESTQLRLLVWQSAGEIIRKNWLFGVGTGDREDSMLAVLRDKNKAAFEMKLNAHNQFLEATLTFGITGLAFLLLIIFVPLKRALADRNTIFISFLLIMAFNMLFESVLQVFQGIVFFTFFYCLFIMLALDNQSRNENPVTS